MKKLMMLTMCVLASGAAMAEPVEFLDYDATTGTFTNAVRECTLVTSATRVLYDGWYAVQGTVTIPTDANLTVAGTVHLILCDGAKLSVENPGSDYAGVNVSELSSLAIYGQTAGTGALIANGCKNSAGIGGGKFKAGGTVTINGGTVTANGGDYGAGIGGGGTLDGYSLGGTVTINGGTVTANGGDRGAGIGGGWCGGGCMVKINGGMVTATGCNKASDIGVGYSGHGGTVMICGGTVKTSVGREDAFNIDCDTVAIDGGAIDSGSMRGDIRIRGGIFKNAPQSEWLDRRFKVFENPDEATKVEYPYAVMEDSVRYLDWDPALKKMTNAVVRGGGWVAVTHATRTLENGKWYVVTNHIVFPDDANLSVDGSAHLILCDGASLTIPKAPDNSAGVTVSSDASLIIYGQSDGTGALTANGGYYAAGIGGDRKNACGTVTINGGMVTATGGESGAGIGGGMIRAGGTVTINGGAVTAVGNGGSDIGPGYSGKDGTVAISGGIFALPPKIEWIAEGYAIGGNSDSATSEAYPYAVMSAAFTVTISDHPYSTVRWTYGNGAVTSLVTGTSFKLGTGMTGVSVIFTPEHGYCFAVEGETGVRTLPSPVMEDCAVEAPTVEEIPCEVTFAVGAGIRRAAYVCGGVTNELVTEETALVVQLGTRVELIVEELPRYYPFAGERTFTVEQETMRVEIFASPIPKGMEGNPFQIGEEVFAYTNTEGVLTITGTGAMSNFVSAADVPWVPATVKKVAVDVSKIQIGANSLSALADGALINETLVSNIRPYVSGFTSSTPVQPSGAISPAEFERIDIVDGKALLGVSVYTSNTLTNENWSVATNGVIEVPAPGKQGFFILKSKPAK